MVNATEPPKGEILVPVMQQGDHSTKMPKHGDSKQTVLEAFGEPLKKVPAVGVPPISRWDYEKFSVYFENNITLHAV
ncbi:MAG: phosphodiesterase, partial [Gammaproteobacteria bacterium CG22_combo_CG10-13_8_21_14_all_40_8]